MAEREYPVPRRLNTKEYIALVFNELLKKMPFEKIKVRDIMTHADISRTTFYRHFNDKFDLLIWFYEDKLKHADVSETDFRKNSNITFQLMAEDPVTFRSALTYDRQNSLTDYIVDRGREFFTRRMKQLLGVSQLPDDVVYAIEFYNGGARQIWYAWVFSKMTKTPEEITQILIDNMPPVLLPCIEPESE